MKQVSTFRYEVEKDEVVSIVATPHGCNGTVTAAEGGQAIPPFLPSPPTFKLAINRPVGKKHRVFLRVDFLPDDEPDASVVISLSGSKGGGAFQGDTLDRPDAGDPDQYDEMGFQFKVVV